MKMIKTLFWTLLAGLLLLPLAAMKESSNTTNKETSTDVSVPDLNNANRTCPVENAASWGKNPLLPKKILGKDFKGVAPSVKVPNQLIGAALGTDVLLECIVNANPTTSNHWVKNRREIIKAGPKYSIVQIWSRYHEIMKLKIRQFSKNDIGTYFCISNNLFGKSEGTIRIFETKLHVTAEVNIEDQIEGAVNKLPAKA